MKKQSPIADPCLQRWSTATVEPLHRAAYWTEAVCEAFLEMNIIVPCFAHYSGELVSAPLADIRLNRVESDPAEVVRSRHAIARGGAEYYYLLASTDSAWYATQKGHTASLAAGDLVLIDSRRPYTFRFAERSTFVSIELSVRWIEHWLAGPDARAGNRIDGSHGWGAALTAFVRQLQPELTCSPPLPAALLSDQLGTLLALAVESDVPASGKSSTELLRQSVSAAIEDRYSECGLTVAHVAQQLGISARTLHRCLADADTTFAHLLMRTRMSAAGQMLGDRRFDRLTLAEIGRRVGLREPSHFARQVRRHFGATPSRLRQTR